MRVWRDVRVRRDRVDDSGRLCTFVRCIPSSVCGPCTWRVPSGYRARSSTWFRQPWTGKAFALGSKAL